MGTLLKPKQKKSKPVEDSVEADVPAVSDTSRPTRLPTPLDRDTLAADRRTRDKALRRRGRLSTILTDRLEGISGSSGNSLGA